MNKKDFIYGLETEHNLFIPGIDLKPNKNIFKKFLDILHETAGLNSFGFSKKHGGKFYIDSEKTIESCTPECKSIKDLVLWHFIQEQELQEALVEFQKKLSDYVWPPLQNAYAALFKENSDRHGNTLGSHENYFIPYEYLAVLNLTRYNSIREIMEAISPVMIPFLIVRPLICGAGKISAEIPSLLLKQVRALSRIQEKSRLKKLKKVFGAKNIFQISQRADYIENMENANSCLNRGLLHASDKSFTKNGVRLHLICGDSNRCPQSLFLRMSSTALVLETLFNNGFKDAPPALHTSPECFQYAEAECIPPKILVKRYLLENIEKPLRDFIKISRHPDLNIELKLADHKRIHPLEIHEYYLKYTRIYLEESGQFTNGWKKEAWELWNWTVEKLKSRNFRDLIGIVDWLTLKSAIDSFRDNKGLISYDNEEILKLENSYFDIYPDPKRSLFEFLKKKNKIHMPFSHKDIDDAEIKLPSERPALRAFILQKIARADAKRHPNNQCHFIDMNWEQMHFIATTKNARAKKAFLKILQAPKGSSIIAIGNDYGIKNRLRRQQNIEIKIIMDDPLKIWSMDYLFPHLVELMNNL